VLLRFEITAVFLPVANNLNTMPYMWQNSFAINALSAPYDVVRRLEDAVADLWTRWHPSIY
jgi:hypothetical protein